MSILYKKGGIRINPANKGKFTATKKKTGKSTEELTHSKNPLTRKRAIFAQNAKKWNHKHKKEDGAKMYKNGGLSRSKDYGSDKKPYPTVDSKDFAGRGRSYPIPTKADAVDALRLAGLHGRDDVKTKVYSKYPELKKPSGILKKKIKYQIGGKSPYVYSSIEELASNPGFKNINIHGEHGGTRCYGSALDANSVCGYNARGDVDKSRLKGIPVVPGDATKNVVDAWNARDIYNQSDDMEVIYDRDRDGELTDEMLKNLPLYSMIGTGDARVYYNERMPNYIDKNYNKKVSRHAITVLGYLGNGSPIVYDLGKFSEGIPEKYLKNKDINYIAAPKNNRVYFSNNTATKPELNEKDKSSVAQGNTIKKENTLITTKPQIAMKEVSPSYYGDMVMSLLSQVFGREYNQ